MRFYWPIAKIDTEQRMVWGYASTEAQDDQGETITRQALAGALDDYMRFANIREMHRPSAVGIATEAMVDDKGLYLAARIVDDEAWEKVTTGVYKGFSIGGRVTARDQADRRVITGLRLTEISVVDRPANPGAVFDCWKFTGEPVTPVLVEPVRSAGGDELRYARMLLDLGWLGDRLAKDRVADLQSCVRALAEGRPVPSLLQKRGELEIEKLLSEVVPRLEALQRRVEDIARTPLPPQTLGRGVNAVTKGSGGAFGIGAEAIVAALAGMSDEERTLTLIKASHANPLTTSGWLPRQEGS